jgi:hypothetical protein
MSPLSSSAQSSSSNSVIVGAASPLLNCTEQAASATTARFRVSINRIYFAAATFSLRSMSEKQTVRLRPPCLAL